MQESVFLNQIFSDLLEENRVEQSKDSVKRVNQLSMEKPGGEVFHNLAVGREDAGKHCPMCRLRGCCLVPNCLGYSGKACQQTENTLID